MVRTNPQQHCSGLANGEMTKASGRKFSSKLSECHCVGVSVPTFHQEADQFTFSVQLLINPETWLALVVFNMREKLVDADCAESWAQR